MSQSAWWIGAAIASARPRALAALLRYFRDLDRAEDAFQEASVRALASWPAKGVPRDPLAWLVFVGRNVAIDERRRARREEELPAEAALSDVSDEESAMATSLDDGHYRDDVLRLLFMCCHPTLAVEQQIALALRIISGLTVVEIARAFMVSPSAVEQRITRAKRRIAEENVPYESPDPEERSARLGAVSAMVYLLFNEGYSATGGESHVRLPLCEEAIRLARLLLGLYPQVSEVMGLTALLLLQHARVAARLDEDGEIVLLDDQDRSRWNRALIDEGTVLIEKAQRHGEPGPFQIQAAIAAIHAAAARAADTDWSEIDALYAVLERLQPNPVVTLNRAVAVSKLRGPEAALAMLEPLAGALNGLFNFHGVRGALLLQCGRSEAARAALEAALARARTTAEAAHVRKELERIPARGSTRT